MVNHFAAALTLSNQQVFGGRRRYAAAFLFILPAVLGCIVAYYGPAELSRTYAQVVSVMLVGFLMPFPAVFWGSSLVTDEIEGKTLVYLWTRPVGRARLFLAKYVVVAGWLVVFSVFSSVSAYTSIYLLRSRSELLDNLPMAFWDARALSLGAAAYAAMAFFLATLIKRPLLVSLLYVYMWDLAAAFLPGFLQRTSIRHHVLTLSTHQPETENQATGLLKLVTESTTTEGEAIATLLGIVIVFALSAAYILRNREFLGDDPARAQ